MKNTGMNKELLYRIMRYLLIILLLAAVVVLLTAKKESHVPFDEVYAAIKPKLETTNMEENASRYLKKYFQLNAEDYADVAIYTPKTNMNAEEFILVKVADASQIETVVDAVEQRIEQQLEIYNGYAPEQVALLEDAIIDQYGTYVLYIVGNNAEEIDNTFRSIV